MDWTQALADERAALKRIVALLFALADLAERAGSRSSLVRSFVLWLLRPAQAVARELLDGTMAPTVTCHAGDNVANAARLALDFRDLARALDRQAAWSFVLCDTDHTCREPAPFGVPVALYRRGAVTFAKALAFPASTRKAAQIAALPDTS